ncbi:MAG: 30S ribosomal protein S3 [Dehalococcoidia bacterium]|nr:MAG: 30S ribosomal protein S3 [Dehalococcoidia bacterium]
MGRKVHPYAFRIGTIKGWNSTWYADKNFADNLLEDLKIRQGIRTKYKDAGISNVAIERQSAKVTVTVSTSRPGIVIGRGGQRVDEMRRFLEGIAGGKRIQLNIHEIGQPELDAYLVARSVADQMERRIAYRRAMKQSMFRTRQAGAQGIKIKCSGRLGGVEIARREEMHNGRVPLHTIRADIDYGFAEANTALGRIGVKVWIYRGDILPEAKAVVEEDFITEAQVAAAAAEAAEATENDTDTDTKLAAEPVVAEVITEPAATESPKPRTRRKVAAVDGDAESKTEAPESVAETEKPKRRVRKATEEKTEEAA